MEETIVENDILEELAEEEFIDNLERVYIKNDSTIDVVFDAEKHAKTLEDFKNKDFTLLNRIKEHTLKHEENILLRGNGYVGQN